MSRSAMWCRGSHSTRSHGLCRSSRRSLVPPGSAFRGPRCRCLLNQICSSTVRPWSLSPTARMSRCLTLGLWCFVPAISSRRALVTTMAGSFAAWGGSSRSGIPDPGGLAGGSPGSLTAFVARRFVPTNVCGSFLQTKRKS